MKNPDSVGKKLTWQEASKTTSAAEADALLDAHFKDVTPALLANEAHHCRTARTDVADSAGPEGIDP